MFLRNDLSQISEALDTLNFKNVIPTSDVFMNSPIALDTIPNISVFISDPNGPGSVVETPPTQWCPEVYRLLLRRYRNWEIANDNIDDFLDMLWEKLEVHVPNYFLRKAKYTSFLKMSDRELLTLGKTISNYVEHTDTRVANPLATELDNVSNQTASQSYGDNSSRIRGQIYNAQMDLLNDFLSKFSKLFIRIGTTANLYG